MTHSPIIAPQAVLAGLLLAAGPSVAQVAQSKIALAQTDGQVERLVQETDKDYANFKVSSALEFADKRVQKKYRQAHVKAWQKADFDGNGRLDLLITGTQYDKESKVICLLDMGDKLVLEPFDRQFYRACPVTTVSYQGTQPYLHYADFAKPFLANDKLEDRQAFRLMYKYGGFIEYYPQPARTARPDSILYESFFAYHSVQEEKLTLAGTGAATYYSCTYPVLEEAKKTYVSQKTQVEAQALATILGLASHLAGQPLKPRYRIGFNHIPHTNLTITYHDGQRLQVQDEGEIGTFGLMRLYALLGQLRKSQSWQAARP
jgi:hypothetical protein